MISSNYDLYTGSNLKYNIYKLFLSENALFIICKLLNNKNKTLFNKESIKCLTSKKYGFGVANFCEIRFLLLEGRWYNVIEHQDVGLQN